VVGGLSNFALFRKENYFLIKLFFDKFNKVYKNEIKVD